MVPMKEPLTVKHLELTLDERLVLLMVAQIFDSLDSH
jgi:hypothetical protein